MQQTTDHLIGSAEAARLIGKSQRTVHRLVHSGALVPVMVIPGGRVGVYLFDREDVQRIAEQGAA